MWAAESQALVAANSLALPAQAQATKVVIAISGWTGFAPLTLAKETGLIKQHGLDVTIKRMPQKDRHLGIASGDIQCAATTAETWVVCNANGVATLQILQLDKRYGADGIMVKPGRPADDAQEHPQADDSTSSAPRGG